MSDNGNGDARVLRWPGRLFSAEDLRQHLRGHTELLVTPKALLTPLALDELRTRGVRIRREALPAEQRSTDRPWGYAQEQADPLVAAAVDSLRREGTMLVPFEAQGYPGARWFQKAAEWMSCHSGCVAFCKDAALGTCLANKIAGLRAAAVGSAMQTARAVSTIGANFLVVEMPGRTLFEVRQILKSAARGTGGCSAEIAKLLGEFEGHAHR
jgi:hypothetical protein